MIRGTGRTPLRKASWEEIGTIQEMLSVGRERLENSAGGLGWVGRAEAEMKKMGWRICQLSS